MQWSPNRERAFRTTILLVAVLGMGSVGCVDDEPDAEKGEDVSERDTRPAMDTAQPPEDTGENARQPDAGNDTTAERPESGPNSADKIEGNVVENWEFEEGVQTGGCPEQWECRTHPSEGLGIFAVDDERAWSGTAAARWQGTSDAIDEEPIVVFSQQFSSEMGRRYEVSAWYRDELDDAPQLQVLFYDADDELLESEYFDPASTGDEQWRQITGETGKAPRGTAYVRFNLAAVETYGTVWWDAASLVDVTDPDDETNDPDDSENPNEDGERPDDAVELCNQGLSDGDRINSYIDDNLSDGATLVVCKGTYEIDDLSLSGDDWTVIAPDGATLDISGRTSLRASGTGWRIAGFIFDQSNTSGYFSMHPNGDDWVVDNVAWKGEHPGGGRLLTPAVESEGATGLIDRMYMGDGQVEGSESGAVYAQYRRGYDGDMTFRRVHIAHFIDNAIYASSPGKYGHKGCTHIEDSFFWSNTISNARTGSPYQRCRVEGNVFLLDDTTQECGVGCSSPGARTTRAVWAWNGDVLVEDNDFTIEHGRRIAIKTYDDRPDGSVTEVNNRVGEAASTDPPAGVPTSPEDIYDNPPGWATPTP